MTSALPLAAAPSYTSPPLVNSISTIQPLPSPPANDAELPKPGNHHSSVADATGHHASNSMLASRRQNVSLPAFTFPSPGQRSFGYGLHSPAPSLLTPPSGNDHLGPVDGSNAVSQSFWAAAAPSHTNPSSSAFSYASAAPSQPAYATASSTAYTSRGIVSPVSSSRSQPLSPHHQEAVPSSNTNGQPSFDGASYSSNLAVPTTHGSSYSPGFSYSGQGPLTPVTQNSLASPHDAYASPPSSLPPPTPSSGYYSQHNPSYSYNGHPISVGPASPPVHRPPPNGSLSHLHPLHASGSLTHPGYQSAHPRYLSSGIAASVYAQHGASIIHGLTPHLAGSPLQHAHIHPSQHASVPHQERPFRCDQCPQSFNRNHDLKRHKRIHLAVKPFPCPNCDKSFSRKDALKRHVLVKGCGNASASSKPASTS
ncbi:hypothetical protein Dda_2921 [Drechslerella dactyloides]|uniref:C2H2-type domain-containing protein n=1 Tax=Drechslerella dactyloides TaxID=74499 RepID=A0AAD6J0X3_DREDA|nr:hypothetical protein Dda_2921 [Drechslerella dactyloides]